MSLTQRFSTGDHVAVIDLKKPGHVRIPDYVRNKHGEIIQYCGRYLNPEDLAVGVTSKPAVDLYRVAFKQSSLWEEGGNSPQDRLVIEIYDHWLKPNNS